MPKRIKIKEEFPNEKPKFIKTVLVKAEREDGEEIWWEIGKSRGSVHILADNIDKKELLLVKQVRIPVLYNDDSQNGIVYEMCAGLLDKDKSKEEIAKEEILEELGYDVPLEEIFYIKTLKSSVGNSGSNSHVFECKVKESYKTSSGGGIHNEDIIVFRLPYNKIENFLNSEVHTDAMTQFLLYRWLYINKINN